MYKIIKYYEQKGCLSTTKFVARFFSSASSSSHRIDVESLCGMVWQEIMTNLNPWISHECDVKGCSEGYVTIDGLEKVSRTICAAPKEKLKLPPGLPNIVQCCQNTGGKHAKASKFCHLHQDLQGERSSASSSATTHLSDASQLAMHNLTQSDMGHLPDHDAQNLLTGCKKHVNCYHSRTAGILAAVRPCGIVVNFMEMYTCESPTQAYIFLWLTFGQSLGRPSKAKILWLRQGM